MNELSENTVGNFEPVPARSSDQKARQNSTEHGNGRTAKRTRSAPRLADRVTALRGQGIAFPKETKSIFRCQDPG
jgi:hypothetical protein